MRIIRDWTQLNFIETVAPSFVQFDPWRSSTCRVMTHPGFNQISWKAIFREIWKLSFLSLNFYFWEKITKIITIVNYRFLSITECLTESAKKRDISKSVLFMVTCDPSGAFLQILLTQQVSYKSKLSNPILRYVLLLILNVHTSPAPNDPSIENRL